MSDILTAHSLLSFSSLLCLILQKRSFRCHSQQRPWREQYLIHFRRINTMIVNDVLAAIYRFFYSLLPPPLRSRTFNIPSSWVPSSWCRTALQRLKWWSGKDKQVEGHFAQKGCFSTARFNTCRHNAPRLHHTHRFHIHHRKWKQSPSLTSIYEFFFSFFLKQKLARAHGRCENNKGRIALWWHLAARTIKDSSEHFCAHASKWKSLTCLQRLILFDQTNAVRCNDAAVLTHLVHENR